MPCPTPGCPCQFIPDHFVSLHNKMDDKHCFCGHFAFIHTYSVHSGRKRARELSVESEPRDESEPLPSVRNIENLVEIFNNEDIKKTMHSVRSALTDTGGYNSVQAKDTTNELALFLLLKALDDDLYDTKFSPSPGVDGAWVALIATPKEYALLCHELLGRKRLLARNPLAQDSSDWQERYLRTLARYKEVFKRTPSDKCWPSLESITNSGAKVDANSKNPKKDGQSAGNGKELTNSKSATASHSAPQLLTEPRISNSISISDLRIPSQRHEANAGAAEPTALTGESTKATTNLGPTPTEAAPSTDSAITVRVENRASETTVGYRVKMSAPFSKMFDSYCSKLGKPSGYFQFQYRDSPLLGHQTPVDIGIKEGNTIYVIDPNIT